MKFKWARSWDFRLKENLQQNFAVLLLLQEVIIDAKTRIYDNALSSCYMIKQ